MTNGQRWVSISSLFGIHYIFIHWWNSIKSIDTDLYKQVYDTDGNFLQALDTLEMNVLVPTFLSLVEQSPSSGNRKFIDLGCGTGRNTIAIIREAPEAHVIGLEPSSKMLDIARGRIAEHTSLNTNGKPNSVDLEAYDMLNSPIPPSARDADGVVSTLVLEHVPIESFFRVVSTMLRPGGILLLTNMHSEMGGISQAGFTDPKTGDKVRTTSYAHTATEVIAGASLAGLKLVGEMKETRVDEELAPLLGPRARKWVGINAWFGGCFRKE